MKHFYLEERVSGLTNMIPLSMGPTQEISFIICPHFLSHWAQLRGFSFHVSFFFLNSHHIQSNCKGFPWTSIANATFLKKHFRNFVTLFTSKEFFLSNFKSFGINSTANFTPLCHSKIIHANCCYFTLWHISYHSFLIL